MSAFTLTHDCPCGRCGYNLRGLPRDGSCPECGAAVGPSLAGERLEWTDRAWVARLRSGCVLLGVGYATLIFWVPVTAVFAAGRGWLFTALACCAAGGWLVSSPGTGLDQCGRYRRARMAARAASLAPPLAALHGPETAVGLAMPAAVYCTFMLVNEIGRRGRSDSFPAAARFVARSLSATTVVIIYLGAFVRTVVPPSPGAGLVLFIVGFVAWPWWLYSYAAAILVLFECAIFKPLPA